MVDSGFGKRVRQSRESKRVGAGELADILGVHRSYLYRIETGKAKNPSKSFVSALVAALGVNPLWLLHGEESPLGKETPDASPMQLAGAIQETPGRVFTMTIRKLDPRSVRTVAGYFYNLAKGVESEEVAEVSKAVALELYAELDRVEFEAFRTAGILPEDKGAM